jgi:hypothetical protein
MLGVFFFFTTVLPTLPVAIFQNFIQVLKSIFSLLQANYFRFNVYRVAEKMTLSSVIPFGKTSIQWENSRSLLDLIWASMCAFLSIHTPASYGIPVQFIQKRTSRIPLTKWLDGLDRRRPALPS